MRPPADVEALTEASWETRVRRFAPREQRFEGATFVIVLALSGWLAATSGFEPTPAVAAYVAAYALASLVVYPLGVGDLVPTAPFLVVLLATVPVAAVPLLVLAGLVLGRLAQAAAGQRHVERVVLAGGDAVHGLGPVAVLLAAGRTDAAGAPAALLAAAFAAHVGADWAIATLREWVVHRIRPALQLPITLQVAALDGAMLPLGVGAAALVHHHPAMPLALLPLVGLLAYTARDRAVATRRLGERMAALEEARRRLTATTLRTGDALAATLDRDAVLDIAVRTAREALDATAAAAAAGTPPRLLAGEADPALLEALGAAAAGGPVERTAGGRHVLALPLGAGGLALAIARPEAFATDERRLVHHLAERAADAVGHVERHDALRRQALVDDLTGLGNHRCFQDVLADAVAGFRRDGTPAALLLVDLDHFKAVNDTFGHLTGDGLLRGVARVLRAACGPDAEAMRYGGEEFAIVLRGAGAADPAGTGEALRRAVAALELTTEAGLPLRATASVGVAVLDDQGTSASQLVAEADRALYRAKARGRDRVEVHAHGAAGPEVAMLDLRGAEPGTQRAARQELAAVLARTLDAKQPSTAGHSETVASLSALVAERLGCTPERVAAIRLAGLVHDCGKIAVPDRILDKPGPLTDEERVQVEVHAEAGFHMLADTVLAEQAVWVRHHHERLDGTGYPHGLAGDDIPLESRIILVADAFEAMVADRPYRRGRSAAAAVMELRRWAGTQFDPRCVEALTGVLAEGRRDARAGVAVA